jgi:SAM-dependent methyltransferase
MGGRSRKRAAGWMIHARFRALKLCGPVLACRVVPLGSLYQRILGHPFVYNQVRPRVLGGIDMSPLYVRLRGTRHTILDVGCGTGDALRYLEDFDEYVGYDTDSVAVDYMRQTYGDRPHVRIERGLVTTREVVEIAPTAAILAGVLHHVPDDYAVALLQTLQASKRLSRVVTQDIVYVPGRVVNNVLSYLDRGKFCRAKEGYEALARAAGLRIEASDLVPSHPSNRFVVYLMMTLVPDK